MSLKDFYNSIKGPVDKYGPMIANMIVPGSGELVKLQSKSTGFIPGLLGLDGHTVSAGANGQGFIEDDKTGIPAPKMVPNPAYAAWKQNGGNGPKANDRPGAVKVSDAPPEYIPETMLEVAKKDAEAYFTGTSASGSGVGMPSTSPGYGSYGFLDFLKSAVSANPLVALVGTAATCFGIYTLMKPQSGVALYKK